MMFYVYIVICIAVIIALIIFRKNYAIAIRNLHLNDFRIVIENFLFLVIFAFLYSVMADYLFNINDLKPEIKIDNKIFYYLYLVSICLLSPAIEELFFRLFLNKKIQNKTVFIFVSSCFFSLSHFIYEMIDGSFRYILVMIPYYLTIGITLCIIYIKRKNIMINLFIHSSLNICILIVPKVIMNIFYK